MAIIELRPFRDEDDFEIHVEPRIQGPVRIKTFAEHKWRLEASTEGLAPNVSLSCDDPCAMPYCYWTGRLCCCEWATNGDSLDVVLDELPVKVEHVDWCGPTYYDPDGEPGYLQLTPDVETIRTVVERLPHDADLIAVLGADPDDMCSSCQRWVGFPHAPWCSTRCTCPDDARRHLSDCGAVG